MEDLVSEPRARHAAPGARVDQAFWRGRRVLVTGHTGFIGGWLCAWLAELGADVTGFALAPPQPSFHDHVRLGARLRGITGDIRDSCAVSAAVAAARPQIVLHLAAQAFVGRGHAAPVETFAANVMGTINLLDAVRCRGAEAAVVMTSDKVYRRPAAATLHREPDPLGGSDPYSGSKACCEIATQAYADAYLTPAGIGVATVRAGNVIGGGDWGVDRLIPDAVRAFRAGGPLRLRRPNAVRPWQHVLDAASGLLLVAQRASRQRASEAWNIGPTAAGAVTVRDVACRFATAWGMGATIREDGAADYPEADFLGLDPSRAQRELAWSSRWDIAEAITHTAEWYKAAIGGADSWGMTIEQIRAYAGRPCPAAAASTEAA